jgi:hypothetical protein
MEIGSNSLDSAEKRVAPYKYKIPYAWLLKTEHPSFVSNADKR